MQRFTTKDVCAALGGIPRTRVQAWVKLSPFDTRPSRERSARRFDTIDLLTMAVFQTLEDEFGIKSSCLSKISAGIHHYLLRPRPLETEELVFIRCHNGDSRIANTQKLMAPGWIINVARERERIAIHLGVEPIQRSLPLIGDASRPNR